MNNNNNEIEKNKYYIINNKIIINDLVLKIISVSFFPFTNYYL